LTIFAPSEEIELPVIQPFSPVKEKRQQARIDPPHMELTESMLNTSNYQNKTCNKTRFIQFYLMIKYSHHVFTGT
jgi:hypothetical protein